MVLEVEDVHPTKGGLEEDWIEMETVVQEEGRVVAVTQFEEGERVVVKVKKGWEDEYDEENIEGGKDESYTIDPSW